MPFAGTAARRQTMNAVFNQPVDLRFNQIKIDLTAFGKGGREGEKIPFNLLKIILEFHNMVYSVCL